jgi:hypothetical protein
MECDIFCPPLSYSAPVPNPGEHPCSVSLEEVHFSPSMESLKSRQFKLAKRRAGPIVALKLGPKCLIIRTDILQRFGCIEKERATVLIETIARWAISYDIVNDIADDRTPFLSHAWVKESALRPMLHYWLRHRSLPDSFLQPNKSLFEIIRTVNSSSLSRALSEAALRLAGNSFEDLHPIRDSLERRRFTPPVTRMIVMLRQTQDGKLVPIFGSKRFRQASAFNHSGRSLREQEFRRHSSNLLLESKDFCLPSSFAELIQAYQVPLTSVQGRNIHFECSELYRDLPDLTNIVSPNCFPTTSSQKIPAPYSVLMYGADISENGRKVGVSGRTGVLFLNGYPVIKELDGVEFLVELKGIGSPAGGIRSLMLRADGRWSPTGGLSQSFAQDEFASLMEENHAALGVKPVSFSVIEGKEIIQKPFLIGLGRTETTLAKSPESLQKAIWASCGPNLALIVRLTPSIERLSYCKVRGQSPMFSVCQKTRRDAKERAFLYGRAIASLFTPRRMRAHLSAHLENILSGQFGLCWQDHADMMPLYLSRAHFSSEEFFSRYTLTLRLLNQVFFYVAKTAKVFRDVENMCLHEFSSSFYCGFVDDLQSKWNLPVELVSSLLKARQPLTIDGEEITNLLWRAMLARDNFYWCLENYDLPHAIFGAQTSAEYHGKNLSQEYLKKFLNSEITFLTDVVNCRLPWRKGPQDHRQVAVESVDSARSLLAKLEGGFPVTAAECKLEYLRVSETARLPRKVESWHK